jgi:hypothetical protein
VVEIKKWAGAVAKLVVLVIVTVWWDQTDRVEWYGQWRHEEKYGTRTGTVGPHGIR